MPATPFKQDFHADVVAFLSSFIVCQVIFLNLHRSVFSILPHSARLTRSLFRLAGGINSKNIYIQANEEIKSLNPNDASRDTYLHNYSPFENHTVVNFFFITLTAYGENTPILRSGGQRNGEFIKYSVRIFRLLVFAITD